MDNVTHSFVGLALGEAAYRLSVKKFGEDPKRRVRFWGVSALANNLPDIDFVYVRITEGPLGYLLHHRGHTHTVVGALALAALVFLPWLLIPRVRKAIGVGELRWLAGLVVLGSLAHMFCDWWNSYGVHPFWPLSNSWHYGDSIFIIEPWIWLVLAPVLSFAAVTRFGRITCALPALAAIALAWGSGYIPVPVAITMTLASGLIWFLAWRYRSPRSVFTALGAVAAIVSIFALTSGKVRSDVSAALAGGGSSITDMALSPYPANPLCWWVISREASKDGASYRLLRSSAAAFPSIWNADHCPKLRPESGQLAWNERPVSPPVTPAFHPWEEYVGSLTNLQKLAQENCWVRAYLRFARMPGIVRQDSATIVMTDARFDFGGSRSFAGMVFPAAPDHCPKFVPPWNPPMQEAVPIPDSRAD